MEHVNFGMQANWVLTFPLISEMNIELPRVTKFWISETYEHIDADGNGDALVVYDLCLDKTLFKGGIAREIVN